MYTCKTTSATPSVSTRDPRKRMRRALELPVCGMNKRYHHRDDPSSKVIAGVTANTTPAYFFFRADDLQRQLPSRRAALGSNATTFSLSVDVLLLFTFVVWRLVWLCWPKHIFRFRADDFQRELPSRRAALGSNATTFSLFFFVFTFVVLKIVWLCWPKYVLLIRAYDIQRELPSRRAALGNHRRDARHPHVWSLRHGRRLALQQRADCHTGTAKDIDIDRYIVIYYICVYIDICVCVCVHR